MNEHVAIETEFLREKEAAGLGNLSGHTFRKYRQLGIGPVYFEISPRCIRYKKADVLRWLEARRVQPEAVGQAR